MQRIKSESWPILLYTWLLTVPHSPLHSCWGPPSSSCLCPESGGHGHYCLRNLLWFRHSPVSSDLHSCPWLWGQDYWYKLTRVKCDLRIRARGAVSTWPRWERPAADSWGWPELLGTWRQEQPEDIYNSNLPCFHSIIKDITTVLRKAELRQLANVFYVKKLYSLQLSQLNGSFWNPFNMVTFSTKTVNICERNPFKSTNDPLIKRISLDYFANLLKVWPNVTLQSSKMIWFSLDKTSWLLLCQVFIFMCCCFLSSGWKVWKSKLDIEIIEQPVSIS